MKNTDLLEGLKRAQRFRLEDQRGTEINFELPDFLKDNNMNTWKTMKTSATEGVTTRDDIESEAHRKPAAKAPQPAPRLSINRNNSQTGSVESGSHLESINENGTKNHALYGSLSQGEKNNQINIFMYFSINSVLFCQDLNKVILHRRNTAMERCHRHCLQNQKLNRLRGPAVIIGN